MPLAAQPHVPRGTRTRAPPSHTSGSPQLSHVSRATPRGAQSHASGGALPLHTEVPRGTTNAPLSLSCRVEHEPAAPSHTFQVAPTRHPLGRSTWNMPRTARPHAPRAPLSHPLRRSTWNMPRAAPPHGPRAPWSHPLRRSTWNTSRAAPGGRHKPPPSPSTQAFHVEHVTRRYASRSTWTTAARCFIRRSTWNTPRAAPPHVPRGTRHAPLRLTFHVEHGRALLHQTFHVEHGRAACSDVPRGTWALHAVPPSPVLVR
jgi:hypothetical protein